MREKQILAKAVGIQKKFGGNLCLLLSIVGFAFPPVLIRMSRISPSKRPQYKKF